jgi:hypothetical protein
MSTVTTNFPRASASRSRVHRSADGVVAGYIRALAGASSADARPSAIVASAPLQPPSYATASAVAADAQAEVNPSQPLDDNARSKKSSCWTRGGRVSHAVRAQRVLEAR